MFDHEGPWTEDAYLALPRTDRVEVVEGTLLVGAGTSPERSTAVAAVREAIAAALPEGLQVRGPVALRLGPDCVLVPDLIVTTAGDEAEAEQEQAAAESERDTGGDKPVGTVGGDEVLDASAALMVVEVIGREHGAVDRTFKPQLYAGVRIPYLLLVDHHGPFAIADMIISGRYHEYARAQGDEPLRLEEPFRLELDLRTITGAPEETHAAG
ncbi:Uma2 family endonuclease [Pseudonocardia humida]|uniref:Uma2 family endonuclease n=1 Tax=Pseudonocardia humida TaxID=2800819 RepID=A0ABT1ADF1_9PSEU|nr:Uma2 family endonuclease [Pseudonocardia humida]MCO1660935.1 Uma2 family endonuclease [Pseudonocardia humida]